MWSSVFFGLIVGIFSQSTFGKTNPVDPAEYSDTIHVACIGDSITYGSKIEDRQGNSYPAQLGKLLGSRYTVANFGRPGARVGLSSLKAYQNFPEYKDSLDFTPDVVILSLGINDCSVKEWPENKKVFVKSYRQLISAYQTLDSKPRIWLVNLMPVMPPYEPYLAIQKNIRECQRLIESIAEREGITVIDLYTELNRQQRVYAEDGIHPSREGAAVIAQKVYSCITGDFGGLQMPYVFGDHMVIQRQKPIRIFGKGNVGDKIVVELSRYSKRTVVDGNGNWQVNLPALQAGGPYMLTVRADRKLEFRDVMIGEVWFCAGQSNMAWPLASDADAENQISVAEQCPRIRLLKRTVDPGPEKRPFSEEELGKITLGGYYRGSWQICSGQTAGDFSAVGYYFAMNLHQSLNVPVGMIQNAIGGAPMETFLPREAFQNGTLYLLTQNWLNADSPAWHRERAKVNLGDHAQGDPRRLPHHPYEPTFIYYADIEELIPYAFRGVIWYQGESNATDVETDTAWDLQTNKDLFKNLICTWRSKWNLGEFPFYYVQLPNLNRNWMKFRQMQFEVLRELPATGMAVTIDLGEANNVHPKSKYEVARRLSLWARAKIYGRKDILYCGPIFNGRKRQKGDKIYLAFDFAGSGLTTSDGDLLRGFEIQDPDGRWHAADAWIDKNCVIINWTREEKGVAIRYAWQPNPCANLINEERLPASPFYVEFSKAETPEPEVEE